MVSKNNYTNQSQIFLRDKLNIIYIYSIYISKKGHVLLLAVQWHIYPTLLFSFYVLSVFSFHLKYSVPSCLSLLLFYSLH